MRRTSPEICQSRANDFEDAARQSTSRIEVPRKDDLTVLHPMFQSYDEPNRVLTIDSVESRSPSQAMITSWPELSTHSL